MFQLRRLGRIPDHIGIQVHYRNDDTMGGAILPKVMGAVADRYDLSRGFIVRTLCFAFVAFYGFMWPRLSKAEGAVTVSTSGGH